MSPGLSHVFAVDVISAVEFDRTGNHLATGDHGGRVVLFERTYTRVVSQLTASCHILFPFLPSVMVLLFILCKSSSMADPGNIQSR